MSTFDISKVRKTRLDLPPRISLIGLPKVGKSTFASQAPGAVFIPTEDGLESIDAEAFPLCTKWQDVLDAVSTLYSEPHEFKTAVVDSADWAERLLYKRVCEEGNVQSIEDYAKGYGKGYVRAAELFVELLDGLNALRTERNMCVIVLCHAEIKRFDDPLSSSYDRWTMKLCKQISKMLGEWSDVIGFAQLETLTQKEQKTGFDKKERTRALSTGRRVMHVAPSPAYDAGNRFGITDSLDLTWAAFSAAIESARKA